MHCVLLRGMRLLTPGPLLVVLVLAFGATRTAATRLSFWSTCGSECFDPNAVDLLVTPSGAWIPLALGSHLEATALELIGSHYEYGPGIVVGETVYRGTFAIYAGIYGLSPDTILISGSGRVSEWLNDGPGSYFTGTNVSGHIEYVHPTLLANLELRPDFQRGHAAFQISSFMGTYADVDLTSIPEPGTEFAVGLGFIVLAALRKSIYQAAVTRNAVLSWMTGALSILPRAQCPSGFCACSRKETPGARSTGSGPGSCIGWHPNRCGSTLFLRHLQSTL